MTAETGRIFTSNTDGTLRELWPSHLKQATKYASHADEIDALCGKAVPATLDRETQLRAILALTALLDAGEEQLFNDAITTSKRWHMEGAGERHQEAGQ